MSSDLPFAYPSVPSLTGARGRPPRGRPVDPARSRRGRTNRNRGNAIEREWCHRMGFRRVGHYGEAADGIADDGMFAGQCKSLATSRFPGWMSDELDKLRAAKPERTPVLGVIEAPGPGRRARRLVVVDEADWIGLHVGERA